MVRVPPILPKLFFTEAPKQRWAPGATEGELFAKGEKNRENTTTLTLQEINISHLGKRKIIFKYALSEGYVTYVI